MMLQLLAKFIGQIMQTKRSYQQIPVELVAMVFFKKLEKPFQVYMYFKCNSDGILNRNSEAFKGISLTLGFSSHNTVNKYLRKLIALNWIGYNAASQNYFVRNFEMLQSKYDFHKNQSVGFHVENIRGMRPFLAAVIIKGKIQNQKYYFEPGNRKKLVTAVNITGAAIQVTASPVPVQKWVPRRTINDNAVLKSKLARQDKPEYYGYSNKRIAKILNCSKTTATDLKHEMERWGFIKTVDHSIVLQVLEKRDFAIRKNWYKAYPELNGKIFFRTAYKKFPQSTRSKKVIEVVLQKYDEIIPLLQFSRINKKAVSATARKVA